MRRIRAGVAAALLGVVGAVSAHSASDAYLTLEVGADGRISGQWDIALRDLDFVLGLDTSGRGEISWGAVRVRQADIARYALSRLGLSMNGRDCTLALTRQLIDEHADGAYAALFFQARCSPAAGPLGLDYRLFFDVDPSHRAILVAVQGSATSTALLSPANARIRLEAQPARTAQPADAPR